MEVILISILAFVVAILTFFSGFGLGTILTPVFMLFFPVELAIALTGVVHFFNNVYKLFLVGKNADKTVLIRFGIPAVISAFLGSWILINISDSSPLFAYNLFESTFEVFPTKLLIAILLIIFALFDLLPSLKKLSFSKDKLPIGGVLSGFFGGLSGNQGALRSAFLIKAGLSKEAFIGTAVVISAFVDFTRLSVYGSRFSSTVTEDMVIVVVCATLSGILGSYIGNKLLKKVTLNFLQKIVGVLLIFISIALAFGFV